MKSRKPILPLTLLVIAIPFSAFGQSYLNIGTLNTISTTSGSAAIGNGNYLDAGVSYSIVTGYENTVNNIFSASIIGTYNQITEVTNAGIVGDSNNVLNQNSVFIGGVGNSILGEDGGDSGYANAVFGADNIIEGAVDGVMVFGRLNYSDVSQSYILGRGNIGQFKTVTLGNYASTVPNAALIVGRGVDENNRVNGLVVLNDGNVQVPGTLTVSGSSLSVAGSPVMTNASAPTVLGSQGFITTSTLSNSIKNLPSIIVGSTSSVTNGGNVAIGNEVQAKNTNAVAFGYQTEASGVYSTALGHNTTASGYASLAAGTNSTAEGSNSFAAGYNVIANGDTAVSFGIDTSAYGTAAFAAGNSTQAMGEASAAFGKHSSAIGSASFATGEWSYASGNSSFAAGFGNATGDYSFASGYDVRANGYTSFSSGHFSEANNSYSGAMGLYTISNTQAEFVVGMMNKESVVLPEIVFDYSYYPNPLEPIFVVGNGDIERSNAQTTLKNGQTTLSNKFWTATTPKVVPSEPTSSAGKALVVEGHTELKGNVTISQPQGDISMGIYQ